MCSYRQLVSVVLQRNQALVLSQRCDAGMKGFRIYVLNSVASPPPLYQQPFPPVYL